MIGIFCRWECPSCGNIINTNSPFWDSKTRKNMGEPKSCGCGKKGGFKLIDFERCRYAVMPKGTKIIDKNGNTVYEEPGEEALDTDEA